MPESWQLSLPDGRLLDVRETGPDKGPVLLFHHGTPGSAVQLPALAGAAHSTGLRLVTTSRPGYGGSSRQPGRTVSSCAADAAAVLDALGAPRCLVAGWSGGGPHALACGALLAERVAGLLVIGGVAPYSAEGLDWMDGMGEDNVREFGLSLRGEAWIRPSLEAQREELKDATPEAVAAVMDALLPEVDREAVREGGGAPLAAQMREGLRLGSDGWVDDDLAFTKPWGFEVEEVTVPVVLWQGTEDLMVPVAHGRWLASRLPASRVHVVPGEGHMSWQRGQTEALLRELVAAAGFA